MMAESTFDCQIPFKVLVSEEKVEKVQLDFKIIARSNESKYLDPKIIEYEKQTSCTHEVVSYEGSYNHKTAMVKDIGSFVGNEEDQKKHDLPLRMIEQFQNNQFMAKYIGNVIVGSRFLIVSEYTPLGTLQDIIDQQDYLPQQIRLKIIYDSARALNSIHSNDHIHFNIKPANILLVSKNISEEVLAKLTDYGYHWNYKNYYNQLLTKGTRPTYIPPEIHSGEEYTQKSDVFSFGMTMYAIATLQEPYPVDKYPDGMSIVKEICEGKRLPQAEATSDEVYKIISDAWNGSVKDRCTMDEVIHELKQLGIF